MKFRSQKQQPEEERPPDIDRLAEFFAVERRYEETVTGLKAIRKDKRVLEANETQARGQVERARKHRAHGGQVLDLRLPQALYDQTRKVAEEVREAERKTDAEFFELRKAVAGFEDLLPDLEEEKADQERRVDELQRPPKEKQSRQERTEAGEALKGARQGVKDLDRQIKLLQSIQHERIGRERAAQVEPEVKCQVEKCLPAQAVVKETLGAIITAIGSLNGTRPSTNLQMAYIVVSMLPDALGDAVGQLEKAARAGVA